MPLYDIACQDCKLTFEIIQSVKSKLPACPACQSENTYKLMSCAALHITPASPLDRGIAPLTGYKPTGRKGCAGTAGGG